MSARSPLPLALTLGEPAGIGPDLTLAVWRRRVELDLPTFYLLGDADFLSRRARLLGLDVPLAVVTPAEALGAFERALPVVPLGLPVTAVPGKPDVTSAPAAIASIRRAVADVMAGHAAAVVTNPVAKNVLYRSGFAEPGHTEFLARLAAETTGKPLKPVMMLWSAELAVVPVTIHLPLRDVVSSLTTDLIVETGRIVAHGLTSRFGIARAGGPIEGATVIEVGPGPGGLTRALLMLGAKRVIAIERDERAIAALEEIAARYPGRLEIVAGDALRFDARPRLGGDRARIIANLPYNIATALLIDWLTIEPWPPWYDALVLMFQREVAERITAAPGSKSYGRLAVLANWRCETKIHFDVAPSAFVPAPKVTSSVVRLVPRAQPLACDAKALQRLTEAAFGQRRKMLRQSLKTLGVDALTLLAAAGIEPTARAEEISVEGFVALANIFAGENKSA